MGLKMLKGKKIMLLDWDNQWQQEKGDEHFLKTDEKEKKWTCSTSRRKQQTIPLSFQANVAWKQFIGLNQFGMELIN